MISHSVNSFLQNGPNNLRMRDCGVFAPLNRIVLLTSPASYFKTAPEVPQKCLCFRIISRRSRDFSSTALKLFSCSPFSACCLYDRFLLSFISSSGHLVCRLHHGRNDQRQNPLQRKRLYLLCHRVPPPGSSLHRAIITQVSRMGGRG